MDWRDAGNPIYKGWLYENSITMIYGQSNVGKSFVALDIAGHIAMGRDWGQLKYKPKDAIGVIYICAEAGQSFGKRGEALRKKLNVEELPFYVICNAPNFSSNKADAFDILQEIHNEVAAAV